MTPVFAFHLFNSFEVTPVGLLCFVGWTIAGLAIGKLLFRDDRSLKSLQREAGELATTLGAWGFQLLAAILRDFSILDFVSLAANFRHAANVMKNPTSASAELSQVLSNMVTYQLSQTTTRQAWFDSVYNAAKSQGLKPTNP